MLRVSVLVSLGFAICVGTKPVRADDRAEALIRAARKAATEAKSLDAVVSFKYEFRGQKSSSDGVLRLLKPNLLLLSLHGRASGDMFRLCDGKTLFTVSPGKQQYSAAPVAPGKENLFGLTVRYSTEALFLAPDRFPGDEAGEAHYAGKENFNGKPYEVVRFSSDDGQQVRILYFGATGLPEGMVLQGTRDGVTERREVWLTDLKLNPPFQASQFVYSPPESYRKVGGD